MIQSSERGRLARTALALLAGNALYSLTVVLFLMPSGLITGGATGIALAANRLTGVPVSGVLLAVNVAMLLAGWVLLGRRFALSTLASTFLSPLTLAVWERLFAGYVLTDDLFLCTIFAGLGIGGALGIVIRVGGSTGGMDIPPLVLQKYFRIPVAASMTVFDLLILFAQAVSSPKAQVLYGVVLVFAYSIVLDKVILLGSRRTEVKLVSARTDELRSAILSELDRGVTLLSAEGGYLRQPGQLLLTVISPRELPRLVRLVQASGPTGGMIVSEVTEVRGRGFSLEKDYLDLEWRAKAPRRSDAPAGRFLSFWLRLQLTAGGSQIKQVGVGAGADKIQFFSRYPVDQQPVRLDMALPAAGVIPGQEVVPVFDRQRRRDPQGIDCLLEQSNIQPPLLAQLQITFEAGRNIQLQHRLTPPAAG